jgi:hypothetical protein
MFNSYSYKTTILSLLAAVLFMGACTEDSNVIFDPDHQYDDADPVITQVIPESSAFAGVGTVTSTGLDPVIINGENFGTDKSQIIVYFGLSRAEIVELRDDVIKVIPPNDPGENRRIRVVKVRAELYSEFPSDPDGQYQLRSIFTPYPGFEDADSPRAITTGFEGELYFMNVESGEIDGIHMSDAEGESMRVSARGESWIYSRIRHGADGNIYAIRSNVNVVYRVDPSIAIGGGAAPTPSVLVQMPRSLQLQDIIFDANGYLWGASNDIIIRIDTDAATFEQYPMPGQIRALQVNGNYLYAGMVRDGQSGVWRIPILGDNTPGEEELYASMPSNDILIRSMAFTAGGDLVMAVNTPESIMIYRNNTVSELYPGIVPAGATTLAVSSSNPRQLLVGIIGTPTRIIKLEMEQEMAPFHGTF